MSRLADIEKEGPSIPFESAARHGGNDQSQRREKKLVQHTVQRQVKRVNHHLRKHPSNLFRLFSGPTTVSFGATAEAAVQ